MARVSKPTPAQQREREELEKRFKEFISKEYYVGSEVYYYRTSRPFIDKGQLSTHFVYPTLTYDGETKEFRDTIADQIKKYGLKVVASLIQEASVEIVFELAETLSKDQKK